MTRPRGELWLVAGAALLLVLIPLLFWGGHYLANGDESKLYYLFPWEYVGRFSPQLISDNSLGTLGFYSPRAYTLLFVALIGVLKTVLPFLNTQLLCYGLNLAGGFIGSYLLLGLFIDEQVPLNRWIRGIAAVSYTFSAFAFYTLWFNQLFAIYLISSFPLVLWLFLRGVRERRPALIGFAALITTLFGVVLLAIPWLLALLIAALPLIVVASWPHWRRLLGFSVLFAVLVCLLNAFWLTHFLYSPFSSRASNDFISRTNAQSFRDENARLITLVTNQQSIVQPLLNTFHQALQVEFDWRTQPIYNQWHRPWLAVSVVFALLIAMAGFGLERADRAHRLFYLAGLVSWLTLLYLFTARIGSWGQPLFLWLTAHVPGFVMFRNLYDKFSLALAVSWMLLLAASLSVLAQVSRRWLLGTLLVLTAGLTLMLAQPMIRGEFFGTPLRTTTQTVESIDRLNADFDQLTAYIKAMKTTDRFVWLPLNEASYVQISDATLPTNHVYSGISPLFFLTGKSDLTGRLSVPPAVGDQLTKDLLAGDGAAVGQLLQPFAVGYVIVNHDVSADLARSYLFFVNRPGDLLAGQGPAFQAQLLGPKLADFGSRYSLYAINPTYHRDRVFLTDDPTDPTHDQPVQVTKVRSSRYHLTIDHLDHASTLVFLDPYHDQWQLRSHATGQLLVDGPHQELLGYANGWRLDPAALRATGHAGSTTVNADGSLTLDLDLTFRPADLAWIWYVVSGLGALAVMAWIAWTWHTGRHARSLVH